MKRLTACLLVGGLTLTAAAQVTNVDGIVAQTRIVNGFASSSLTITNNYPTQVDVLDIIGGGPRTDFANRHDMVLADGGSAYLLHDPAAPLRPRTSDSFDLSVDVTLDAGSLAPRKEAGLRFNFNGFDGLFIITSDGEIAAFGGILPFFARGGAYTPGTVANLRVLYTADDDTDANDGDASTIQYFVNGVAVFANPVVLGNLENGFIPGTSVAMFGQFQRDDSNPGDFGRATFDNIALTVPEPTTAALLLAATLLAVRRRLAA